MGIGKPSERQALDSGIHRRLKINSMLLTTFGNTVDVNIVFSHNTVLNKGHPYVRENLNGLFRTQVGIQYGVETQSYV